MAKKVKATARGLIDQMLAASRVTVEEAALLWNGRVESAVGEAIARIVANPQSIDFSVLNQVLRKAMDKATIDEPWSYPPDSGVDGGGPFADWPIPLRDIGKTLKFRVYANFDKDDADVDIYAQGGAMAWCDAVHAFSLGVAAGGLLEAPQRVHLFLPLPKGDFFEVVPDQATRDAQLQQYGAAIRAELAAAP